MSNVVVSMAGAATTDGIGAAQTGQAEQKWYGALRKTGSGTATGSGVSVWEAGNDATATVTVVARPPAGSNIAVLAGSQGIDYHYYAEINGYGGLAIQKKHGRDWPWASGTVVNTPGGVVTAGSKVWIKVSGPANARVVEAGVIGGPTITRTDTDGFVGPYAGLSGSSSGGQFGDLSVVDHTAPTTPTTPPPDTPGSLTATAVSQNAINVTWGSVSGASSYDLEADGVVRAVSGSPWQHTGLIAGTNHSYRVRSRGTGGTSAWSSVVTATTKVPDTEPPPVDPTIYESVNRDPEFQVKIGGRYYKAALHSVKMGG